MCCACRWGEGGLGLTAACLGVMRAEQHGRLTSCATSCCLFAQSCHCPHALLALCAGDQAAGGPLRERACGAGPAGLARHLELLQGQEGCEPCPRLLSCWQCCAAGMQCTALLRTAAAGGCRGTGQMPLDLQVQARHGVLACHTPSSPALPLLLQATAARPSCPRTRRCRSAAALVTPSTMARWAVRPCHSAPPCCDDHRSMCVPPSLPPRVHGVLPAGPGGDRRV